MLDRIRYWHSTYAQSGMPDKRAVHTYMDCENDEFIRSLQNELVGLSQGVANEETLQLLLGKQRSTVHGSYAEWARLMLRWMSEYRR